MSPVAIGLDLLLAILLLVALALGWKLNGRLKGLREGQADFVKAIAELNAAAARAEAGLAALKAASEGAHDELLARIETARALTARLDRAVVDAERQPARPERKVLPERPTGGAMAAIAALAEGRAPERARTPAEGGPGGRRASRPSSDDDLFETPPRAGDGFGPLRPPRGDR